MKLQCYLDSELRNECNLAAEFDDAGGWRGEKPGCDRPQDQILAAAFPPYTSVRTTSPWT